MYRSFVTCDDPKGVVECGTFRKSKSGSQKMEYKIGSHKAQKNSRTALAYKAEKEELVSKGIMEEYHTPSSFQLLEVSRGAQKLNQTIDSWSKGLSYKGQSKDIAKDLLKGALDLQESLLMLGKLQEASQYMAQLKRQKEKLKIGGINEVGAETMNSHQFGDQHFQNGFQKPRLSADGSSKDCIDELKKAITDSLARQNLLPIRTNQEKTSYERRKMDSASDVPSTSSSQSSVAQSSSSHSTRLISAAAPPRKEKGPNLIAKLMGLENMPSKPLQKNPRKQLDVETDSSQMRLRPVFDIEMPKVRKPQPLIHKVGSERRTLKDILETMQFKGLLKSHSVEELKSWSHHSRETHTNQRSINDFSPIVLIKPSVSCLKSKEDSALMVWEMGALKAKLMPRNVKLKEWPDPRSVDYKVGTYSIRKKQGKTEVDVPPIKRLGQEGAKDRREVVVKPKETEIKTVVQEEVAVHANKKNRELEPEETPTKKLSKELVEDHKDVVPRAEEERVKTKLKGSSKLIASFPVTNQQQKKETIVKKVNKTQKVDTNSRKRIETEVLKPRDVSKSQDQAKVTSTKTRIENGSVTMKTQIPQLSSTNQKSISKHTTKTIAHGPKDQKKKPKLVAKPTAEKTTSEKLGYKEDDKKIGHTCDIDPVCKVTSTPLADLPSTEEEANVSKFHKEHCCDCQSSCNHTLVTSEHEKDAKSSEETNDDMDLIEQDGKSFKNGTQLNALLLSSPLFLTRAEDLFDLNMNSPKTFPTSGIYDSQIANMELSLDYANEYIERRSRQDSQTKHPLLQTYTGDSRLSLSLEKLVDEVVNGAETLTNYCKLGSYNLPTDSLYGILERDIKSGSGVVSGTWDLGWKNGFSVDEAEATVNDIEKLLVSELIEDMFT